MIIKNNNKKKQKKQNKQTVKQVVEGISLLEYIY